MTAWPVHRLWADPTTALAPARSVLRVWREGFIVFHAAMDPVEEQAFDRLVAGEAFAAICEGFDDPAAAAALLLRWVEDGVIAGASCGGAEPPARPRA